MYNLKELRKQKNKTQQYMANMLGVSQQTYSYWENGKFEPDNESIKKLAIFFNVSTDYLLGSEGEEIKKSSAFAEDLVNQTLDNLGIAGNLAAQKDLLAKIGNLTPDQKNLVMQVIDNFKKDSD